MKNLIIITFLVFTFGFKADDKQISSEMDNVVSCTTVTLSCGPTGPVCGATFADLMRNIKWAENHFCGDGIK